MVSQVLLYAPRKTAFDTPMLTLTSRESFLSRTFWAAKSSFVWEGEPRSAEVSLPRVSSKVIGTFITPVSSSPFQNSLCWANDRADRHTSRAKTICCFMAVGSWSLKCLTHYRSWGFLSVFPYQRMNRRTDTMTAQQAGMKERLAGIENPSGATQI